MRPIAALAAGPWCSPDAAVAAPGQGPCDAGWLATTWRGPGARRGVTARPQPRRGQAAAREGTRAEREAPAQLKAGVASAAAQDDGVTEYWVGSRISDKRG
jgi:hypothetical protein